MYKTESYKIAEHIFNIAIQEDSPLWQEVGRFHCFNEKRSDCPLFTIYWRDFEELSANPITSLMEDNETTTSLQFSNDGHIIENKRNGDDAILYRIIVSANYNVGLVSTQKRNNKRFKSPALLHAIRYMYYLNVAKRRTLTFHASCIIKDDKAILFHAPCGTGKSTHSQQWMKAFPDAELLNDDGPIVRVWPDGRVIAYGSPWSGQTPCYKNLSAPVAAFVRINRAKENKIHQLSPVEAYASLMPSCTGRVKWNPEITEAQHQTLEKIISSVPCYQLDCLPNEDAARVCAAEVLK